MEEKEVLSGALAKAELGRVTARAALADLVAAAEPAVNTMAILLNAIGGQSGSPADVDRTKLYDAIERARKVMKEEK